MTRADWLAWGLKLLGVYFFVDGLGHVLWAVLTILQTLPQAGDWGTSSLFRIEWSRTLAYAVVRLGAGIVLVFGTNMCMRLMSGSSSEPPSDKQQPIKPAAGTSGIQELPRSPRG